MTVSSDLTSAEGAASGSQGLLERQQGRALDHEGVAIEGRHAVVVGRSTTAALFGSGSLFCTRFSLAMISSLSSPTAE